MMKGTMMSFKKGKSNSRCLENKPPPKLNRNDKELNLMPTVFTHPAVPLAMGMALGRKVSPPALLVAGVAASILPDLDIITYHMGIPLSHEYGHRGFSHSILFAIFAALLGAHFLKAYKIPWYVSAPFLFIATISHGILDAFTNGGHGIAFFWPWTKTRYFSPFRVIQISPIRIERIFSYRIPKALVSEFFWVWLPLFAASAMTALTRKYISLRTSLNCIQQKVFVPNKFRGDSPEKRHCPIFTTDETNAPM